MKKFFNFLFIYLLFLNASYSDEVDLYCIVSKLDLKKANVAKEDQNRFAGKVIKFKINFDENLIYDISSEDQLNLLSGINTSFIKFEKVSGGIKYSNNFEVKMKNGKMTKYKYNNYLNLNINSAGKVVEINTDGTRRNIELNSRVKQTGLSFKNFNFSFPCRSKDYNDAEISMAKVAAFLPGIISTSEKTTSEKTRKNSKKIDYDWSKLNNNNNKILDPNTYVVNDINSLLKLYKAKLFENNNDNSIFLKNRKYLHFEPGQEIVFDDIKNLDERQFFRLPLYNSKDKDLLKTIKKEYLIQKKSVVKKG